MTATSSSHGSRSLPLEHYWGPSPPPSALEGNPSTRANMSKWDGFQRRNAAWFDGHINSGEFWMNDFIVFVLQFHTSFELRLRHENESSSGASFRICLWQAQKSSPE
ncbi:hypothetical protein R1flu_021165 [Riccia fluitans]|uniref:Uncharacterized protein n=1 Tax=Riccia fluitans TaxID=41844 RepID=A0ABD1ZP43_9MARC